MTEEDRLSVFLSAWESPDPEYLTEYEKAARALKVPIIRKSMQRLLRVILSMNSPEHILEIGTGIGYSAVFMKEYDPALKELVTIENYAPRIREAKKRIPPADPKGVIEMRQGDAGEILPSLPGEGFELVFLDGAKGQYPVLLSEIKRVMKKGAVLLTDNVLFQGDILESRFLVTRRDRTIHKRMREYLKELLKDPEFSTTVLPVADGAAISVKL